jgi:hypothetical protein
VTNKIAKSDYKNGGEWIMKKILAVVMIMFVCFTGCQAAGPRPPIELPFAVHQAGATVSTKLRILEVRSYPFALLFMFKENDKADRERVRKLVGYSEKNIVTGKYAEPGIPITLKLTISIIESSGEKIFLEKEFLIEGESGYSANYFERKIDFIRLSSGLYRVTVKTLKDVPELANTKVSLGIYPRQRGKS